MDQFLDVATDVSAGVAMLAFGFVVLGLLGRGLQRLTGTSDYELRHDPIYRSHRAAWAVRLLRPAVLVFAAGTVAFVVFAAFS